jgi:hypothetical protein
MPYDISNQQILIVRIQMPLEEGENSEKYEAVALDARGREY